VEERVLQEVPQEVGAQELEQQEVAAMVHREEVAYQAMVVVAMVVIQEICSFFDVAYLHL
jgi:hypothetical protein